MSAAPTRERVIEALRQVMDPELGRSLVDLGMIRDVQVEDGGVRLTLAVTTMACPLKAHLAAAARAAAAALAGVKDVEVETVQMTEEEQLRIFSRVTSSGQESDRIQRVVAVTSCTGAVGKSTVTALLATELARRGRRVGILDADGTEPSICRLFGLDRGLTAGPGMPARTALGIEVAAVDLLRLGEDEAAYWGTLDDLLVDLAPGTPDAALAAMECLPLSGLVLVTTPRALGAMDVCTGLRVARRLGVPVLGVVENMGHWVSPHTGRRHEFVEPEQGEELARLAAAPLLARLPLDPSISGLSHEGRIEEYASEETRAMAQALVIELAVAATEEREATAEVANVG